MPEYKPYISKKIDEWSGAKSESPDPPKVVPFPPAREVFAPPRKELSSEEAQGLRKVDEALPKKRPPRPSYKLPE